MTVLREIPVRLSMLAVARLVYVHINLAPEVPLGVYGFGYTCVVSKLLNCIARIK